MMNRQEENDEEEQKVVQQEPTRKDVLSSPCFKCTVPLLLFAAAIAYLYGIRVHELAASQWQRVVLNQATEPEGTHDLTRFQGNGTRVAIYNQELFHWEVVAGYVQLMTSMLPGEVAVYVKSKGNKLDNNLGYGFRDLVNLDNVKLLLASGPVMQHEVMIFISPEYRIKEVQAAIERAQPKLVLMLVHNGNSKVIELLTSLHPQTRIITLSPHVHKFILQRYNLTTRGRALTADNGAHQDISRAANDGLIHEEHYKGSVRVPQTGVANMPSSHLLNHDSSHHDQPQLASTTQEHPVTGSTPRDSLQTNVYRKLLGLVQPATAQLEAPLFHESKVSQCLQAVPGFGFVSRAVARILRAHSSVVVDEEDKPLTPEQSAMLTKGDWMLPILDWSPQKQCERFELVSCIDGFAIQGKAEASRRNYTYVFDSLLTARDTLSDGSDTGRLAESVKLTILGSNAEHTPDMTQRVKPLCRPLSNLDFQPFYDEIYHSVMLVAAPGSTAYLDRKFSSTVISSLVTGVPVVVERDFLQSYTFITDKHYIVQEEGQELSDMMTQVLQWDESQHRQRRLALRQLRYALFEEARQKVRQFMSEAGLQI